MVDNLYQQPRVHDIIPFHILGRNLLEYVEIPKGHVGREESRRRVLLVRDVEAVELGVGELAGQVVEPYAARFDRDRGLVPERAKNTKKGNARERREKAYPVPVPTSAMQTFEDEEGGSLIEGWRMYPMLSFQM